MLYYDLDKDVSVFSAGKHATWSWFIMISEVYKDKPFTLDETMAVHARDFHAIDYDIPVYSCSPLGYVDWSSRHDVGTKYILIRDPEARLMSGLLTNLRIEGYARKVKSFDKDASWINTMWDKDYKFNNYHIGPYLQHLLQEKAIFVPIEKVTKLYEELLNAPLGRMNDSTGRLVGGHTREYWHEEFIARRKANTYPKFNETLEQEKEAYEQILNTGEIYE